MKSILPAIAIATGGLMGLASFGANAADGTITVTGTVLDTTCSINGTASGVPADKSITLAPVSSGSLSVLGATAATSSPTDLALNLSGCSGTATKAIARFENGPTVDQNSGNLTNSGTATNVQVQLLNAQMQPINITTNSNNQLASNASTITGGAANLKYFAQYYATGKAGAGTVNTSVQYTMQYQ
ncbi:fimbrial protein [Paraburkholderia caffeinilytica]|uniref:Ferrous iron transporter B n=1 Tax=Paraburkholderia caffeinilytica TaxID=1761016 RepID=A0ABQ1MR25_9BURK|nr:fimbrial protein [Paraburkholderia caffeinilytica]AXL50636.1 fimbrial protein [Paraburkholderia caffeinilytica]GGC45277.1 ferrous iron transporter B [Paraburkholderia caffeinilytica]CAB3801659.1 Major fimbrial subunit SMF-1 [Paraburkholderia caffeinilytica]